jgi:hypothetical protein
MLDDKHPMEDTLSWVPVALQVGFFLFVVVVSLF